MFCARQNLPFRGHRDDSQYYEDNKNNPGNFQELIKLMIKVGLNDLVGQLSSAPLNATYRSKTTQNELIAICADQVRSSIISEIKSACEFAVLADEASDISNNEQMAFVVRFVDESSVIREEFLDFLHCSEGTTGVAISKLILETLKSHGPLLSLSGPHVEPVCMCSLSNSCSDTMMEMARYLHSASCLNAFRSTVCEGV